MNQVIETLNAWADHAVWFAWPMLWQSSVLIGVLWVLDLLLKRKVRPAVRYALWLVVLVKLVLPPSLACPTGAGWWLRPAKAAPAKPPLPPVVVTYVANHSPALPTAGARAFVPPAPPRLSAVAWAVIGAGAVSLGLLAWMLVRWHRVAADARRAVAAPAQATRLLPELPRRLRLRLTDRPQSPAVCGLFRPVILLPRSLVEQLPPAQLRAVLLHELLHLRRGDVWVNCAQTLLQIVYWWHPLLWFANARIRRVREEAVDDAVMLALDQDAESYAPTLLEVARLALQRPLASLGLVGILESRSALRQRIERLVKLRPPRKAGLGLASALGILGFAALAVPMGEAPAPSAGGGSVASPVVTNTPSSPGIALTLEEKMKVSTLVQDGKLLYEMGRLDQAETRLKLALKEDPQNPAARYYLNLVSEAKFARPSARRRGGPDVVPVPNLYVRPNLIRVSLGRQAIVAKLDSIRLERVWFDGLPLSEVLRSLNDEIRKRDPEKRGINFLLNQGPDNGGVQAAPQPGLGPDGGALPTAPPEPSDLGTIIIKIDPALTDIRLADVLDAIVKAADRPLKYSIEDYAVVFSLKEREAIPLYVRTFKVDPNALYQSLHSAIGFRGTNGLATVIKALRDYFTTLGADLDPVKNPGKTVYFNDRQGMLMIRATRQDLDVIEQVISAMNTVPPQINIKTKFVEVSREDTEALGFDRYLGNTLITSSPTGGQGSAAPSPSGAASDPTDGRSSTLSGILSDAQYRSVLKALEQRKGAEVIAQPEVTTSSGRQTLCRAMVVMTIVKGPAEEALTPPGITITNGDESLLYGPEQAEFGPVLDINPTVLPDGYTINLSLTASLCEFLGYGDNQTNHVTVYVNGKPRQILRPQPVVRKAEVTSQVNVLDGQTLVLGGLVSERARRAEPKPGTQKRHVLIFVTPTLVDPAGNLIHTADEMPLSREAIPPQPPR